MAGRRAGAGLALAAIALSAAGCGNTKTVTVIHTRTHTVTVTTTRTVTQPSVGAESCTGPQLAGKFTLVPGSGAAGQVAYLLTLKNTSPVACSLLGLPQAQLLSASGSALPTRIVAGNAGGAGGEVILAPGASASSQARFSPSVPGTGDSQSGPCQPKAYTLAVTPGGSSAVHAPIKPPTSVCEQGTLAFDPFTAAR